MIWNDSEAFFQIFVTVCDLTRPYYTPWIPSFHQIIHCMTTHYLKFLSYFPFEQINRN